MMPMDRFRWLLAAAILAEGAWLLFLAVLALR
jgi:hypothetical protein